MSETPSVEKPCEHLMPAATYNVTRFACRCGRFLADSGIRHTDHRDDSRYYGIRSEVEWDCSRCGTVKGEELEPQIVVTATRVLPPGHGVEDVDDFLTAYDSQPGIDTTVLPPVEQHTFRWSDDDDDVNTVVRRVAIAEDETRILPPGSGRA